MHRFWSLFLDGIRATLLRRPRSNITLFGGDAFVAGLFFYLSISLLSDWLKTDTPRIFVGWGLSTLLADATLTLLAAWVLVRLSGREGITWGVAAIALAATAATSLLIHWPLQAVALSVFRNGNAWFSAGLIWLSRIWWLLILIGLARWLMPRQLPRAVLAAFLAFAISAMPWWWMTAAPLIMQGQPSAQQTEVPVAGDALVESGFDGDSAQADSAQDESDFDPEQLMFDQPHLLGSAIDALKPRTPGKTNLYVVAFAGDGSENVFRNEVEYADTLFSKRFDANGHVIVLENNPASVAVRPLATLTNLRIALGAIAEQMDPAEDILLVYLTSHGSHDHQLYVALDPLPLNQITPEDLSDALKTSPSMRWKVLVVNACYSGGFIDALRDDSTMVITAARSDRTSFGCGSESEITYFGNAFLADALNSTTSLPLAFTKARSQVAEWEARDKESEPSEPQFASSPSIEAKLEKWRTSLPESSPVPFAPAINPVSAANPED